MDNVILKKQISYSEMLGVKPGRYVIRPWDLAVFVISFISSCIFLLFNTKEYCNSLVILPILFGVCYIFLAAPVITNKHSKTMIIVSICEFLRCVFLPVFIAFSDYSGFRAFSTDDKDLIFKSALLMSWEMIVIFVFLGVIIMNQRVEEKPDREVILAENKAAIYIIIIIGIVLYLTSPQVRDYISFFSISSGSEKVRDVAAGGSSSLFTGLIALVHDAFLCIFILVLDSCANKYCVSNKKFYVWIATLVGLITISVIFGESRATIVYTLFAIISCFRLKFRKFTKGIGFLLLVAAFAVLIGMTIYRLFAVYKYDTYAEAIAKGGYMGQNYTERFMEGYLLGPQSVSAGIEFKNLNANAFTVERLFYDLFRPCMGFNFILRNYNLDTSITMYNSWLTGIAGRSNGFFLQITAQGYCYFGFLLAPIFTCLFLWISVKLENKMKKTQNLFVYFFLSYVFIRTSTCVLGGTMSGYITNASMTLLVCGFFFLMQRIIGSILTKR